jgi:hypothetical protein
MGVGLGVGVGVGVGVGLGVGVAVGVGAGVRVAEAEADAATDATELGPATDPPQPAAAMTIDARTAGRNARGRG